MNKVSYNNNYLYIPNVPRYFYRVGYFEYGDRELLVEAISRIILDLNPPIDLGNGDVLETHNNPTAHITFKVNQDSSFFDMAVSYRGAEETKFNVAFLSNIDKKSKIIEPKGFEPRI